MICLQDPWLQRRSLPLLNIHSYSIIILHCLSMSPLHMFFWPHFIPFTPSVLYLYRCFYTGIMHITGKWIISNWFSLWSLFAVYFVIYRLVVPSRLLVIAISTIGEYRPYLSAICSLCQHWQDPGATKAAFCSCSEPWILGLRIFYKAPEHDRTCSGTAALVAGGRDEGRVRGSHPSKPPHPVASLAWTNLPIKLQSGEEKMIKN